MKSGHVIRAILATCVLGLALAYSGLTAAGGRPRVASLI